MRSWWKTLRSVLLDSLWFLPALFTLGAAALAILLVAVDAQRLLWSGEIPWWVYQGGAQGARSVLDTITGA